MMWVFATKCVMLIFVAARSQCFAYCLSQRVSRYCQDINFCWWRDRCARWREFCQLFSSRFFFANMIKEIFALTLGYTVIGILCDVSLFMWLISEQFKLSKYLVIYSELKHYFQQKVESANTSIPTLEMVKWNHRHSSKSKLKSVTPSQAKVECTTLG